MTTTEVIHPELTPELVERVRALSPQAFEALREIHEREQVVAYDAEVRAHIQAMTQRVLSGEEPLVDWEDALAELKVAQLVRDGR